MEKLTTAEAVRRGLTPVEEPQIVYLKAVRNPGGRVIVGCHEEFDHRTNLIPHKATAYVLGEPKRTMNALGVDDYLVPIQFYR